MGMSGATRSGHRRAAKKCIEQHVRSRLAGLTTFRSYKPGPSRGRTRTTLVSFQFVICSTSLSAAAIMSPSAVLIQYGFTCAGPKRSIVPVFPACSPARTLTCVPIVNRRVSRVLSSRALFHSARSVAVSGASFPQFLSAKTIAFRSGSTALLLSPMPPGGPLGRALSHDFQKRRIVEGVRERDPSLLRVQTLYPRELWNGTLITKNSF